MNSNTFRRSILVMGLLMMTSLAWAQRNQGPPPQPSRTQITEMVNELSEKLKLSDAQASQISALYQNHFDEVKSLMSQSSRNQPPEREMMEALRQAFETQVQALLTTEQKDAYVNLRKEQKPQTRSQRSRG